MATFESARVSTTGPVFDLEKLDWLNGSYVRSLTPGQFFERATPVLERAGIDAEQARKRLRPVLADLQERTKRLNELPDAVSFFFAVEVEYDAALLVPRRSEPAETRALLEAALDCLESLPEFATEP